MTVGARRSIALAAVLALAIALGSTGVSADELDDKRVEAKAIAGTLADQARAIVALDRQHRAAQDELAQAEAALGQAQNEAVSAQRRLEAARALLVTHAQAAYVLGGSISFVSSFTGDEPSNGVARRTYLNLITGEDRDAIGRMRAAREDFELRQLDLDNARSAAAQVAEAAGAELEALRHARNAQQALYGSVEGEIGELVAAEQTRIEQIRQARIAAAAPPAGTPLTRDEAFACIRQLESNNNYSSPSGGAYQFLDPTWQSLGYSGAAEDHPPAVQDKAARELQVRSGWSQWSVAPLCGLV